MKRNLFEKLLKIEEQNKRKKILSWKESEADTYEKPLQWCLLEIFVDDDGDINLPKINLWCYEYETERLSLWLKWNKFKFYDL